MLRQVAYLVEEERAARGGLELARVVAACVGEGPPDVAEEFALEERVGDGADVDVDERLVAAQRQTVYLAREDILARTVFARDEDVGVGDGDLVDDLRTSCFCLVVCI